MAGDVTLASTTNIRKAESRVALHEFVRTGMGRKEDLLLLKNVILAAGHESQQAVALKIVKECTLREEWRLQKEQHALDSLQNLELFILQDSASQTLLDEVIGLQQVCTESISRSRSKSPSRMSKPTPPTRPKPQAGSLTLPPGPRLLSPSSQPNSSLQRPHTSSGTPYSRAHSTASPTRRPSPSRKQRPGTAPRPQPSLPPPNHIHSIRKLQGTLLHTVQRHQQLDGREDTLRALQASTQEAQRHYHTCIQQALHLLDGPGSTAPESAASTVVSPEWQRVLVGYLGTTRGDLQAAEIFRVNRAARVIQRQVRRWQAAVRAVVQQKQRRQEYAAAEGRAREEAAGTIQRCYRGMVGRRAAEVKRGEAEEVRAWQRVQLVKLNACAGRIQRCYRAFRRRRQQTEAMQRARERSRAEAAALRLEIGGLAGDGDGVVGGGGDNGLVLLRGVVLGWKARREARRRTWAVGVLQRWLRGWMVRRGGELRWARQVGGMRRKRALEGRWLQQRKLMAAVASLEGKLLGVRLAAEREVDRVGKEAQKEVDQFEAAWQQYMVQQLEAACQQPLPRNWIPQPQSTGRLLYVNTRSGQAQEWPPAADGLQQDLPAQRAAGEAVLKQRLMVLYEHQERVRLQSREAAEKLERCIEEVCQQLQAPG